MYQSPPENYILFSVCRVKLEISCVLSVVQRLKIIYTTIENMVLM